MSDDELARACGYWHQRRWKRVPVSEYLEWKGGRLYPNPATMEGEKMGERSLHELIEERGPDAMCEMWTPMGEQIVCTLGDAWDELDRYDHHDQRELMASLYVLTGEDYK